MGHSSFTTCSVMARPVNGQLSRMETMCASLLQELQMIWDEVGESEAVRDVTLLELEQECLEVYRRKVAQASSSRAQLRQAIADSEAELAAICSAMGERPVQLRQPNPNAGSLKEELNGILPQLEEMQKRKSERLHQFIEVLEQINKIHNEIRPGEIGESKIIVDESDLSIKRLEELNRQLQALQKEKTDRLKQVLDYLNAVNALCSVLGMDFKQIISEVHPSLDETGGSKSICNNTIERLGLAVQGLRDIKIQRMQKLQDLASSILELWNLMDTPMEEQQLFQDVTCNIAASEHEITEPDTLSLDLIGYVETEVLRLEELKVSKMKDLVLKKKLELEELHRRAHIVAEADDEIEFTVEAFESGAVDPSFILEQIEIQISNVKEEAFSRKEILEKVEKWLAACEEECWLEEYNRDENRYSAGRGAHLMLKRAEKARATVNKIPGMVDALTVKTTAWEREKGTEFRYDGVKLLSMLEEYTLLRQEKEQARRRQRDQKRLQGQLIAEQEAIFGSKPSPSKPPSAKKAPSFSAGPGSRRLSLGGAMLQPAKHDFPPAKPTRTNKKTDESAMPSAGGRGLDAAGFLAKRVQFNSPHIKEETEAAAMPRRPFSPMAAAPAHTPLRPMIGLAGEENRTPQKAQTSVPKPPMICLPGEEKGTPQKYVQIAEPKTPKTTTFPTTTPFPISTTAPVPLPEPQNPITPSIYMQMAPTPAPPPATYEERAVYRMLEEIEYSFEEIRAGFVLPKKHVKPIIV
ncbi:hypothetical protein Taro_051167 [Colocasia esculenta]|uniref:Uncharacterized protein n=1 Tax=Colocasia esculenta TaxID=4460 RepID=A0A843XG27_COLES|nr:hypothetical protein [Colocasia esculenta]